MIIISDTSAICYLLIINQIDILPALYTSIIIPQAVADELSASESPNIVQSWISQPPDWLQIKIIELNQDIELDTLDLGEREAIVLAEQVKANLVILDDKAARRIAAKRGLKIIGLLGVIKDAAKAQLLDVEVAFDQLQTAGFWVAPSLLKRLLTDDFKE
ncbi:MAG: DUF3368 domain-containing protein [Symploca sp. SIO1C2]|nr:DUF3368 domain-containing protein [Symploca sp. SIO1C2]